MSLILFTFSSILLLRNYCLFRTNFRLIWLKRKATNQSFEIGVKSAKTKVLRSRVLGAPPPPALPSHIQYNSVLFQVSMMLIIFVWKNIFLFFSNYKRIQILQNKIIRLIEDIKEQIESKTIASFSRCKVLMVGQIRDYQASIFVFQVMKHICPEYFHDYFSMNREYHKYDTRNSQLLSHEKRKTVRSSYVVHNLGHSS